MENVYWNYKNSKIALENVECPKCKKNSVAIDTTMAYPTIPPQYKHLCRNCGYEFLAKLM